MPANVAFDRARLWQMFDLGELRPGRLGEYLEHRLKDVADWFQATGGSIFLASATPGTYSLRAATGDAGSMPPTATVSISSGYAGRAIENGLPIIVDQARDGIFSAMVIPLVQANGEPVGVLNLSRSGEPAFGESELAQAKAIAAHLSLIVTNAQSLDRLGYTLDQLEVANERLSAILDAVGAAVMVVEPGGRLRNRNLEALDLLGSHSNLEPFLADCSPRLADAVRRAQSQQFASGHCEESDRHWHVRWVKLSDGSAVLSVQETTEAERNRRNMSRLNRLAEIGQMTASIAHEIRNPLTGISSAAKMILDSPSEGSEFAEIVIEETAKLDSLCNEFLEFARPIELNREPATLEAVVERVAELERSQFDEEGARLEVKIESNFPIISIDVRRMEQAVRNLVRNAREASGDGGSVTVIVADRRVSVLDDGPGMDQQALNRLFSPFFTTKANGTGLGLCTVRKIMDAHGGDVRVESIVGEGSRFEIALPGGES